MNWLIRDAGILLCIAVLLYMQGHRVTDIQAYKQKRAAPCVLSFETRSRQMQEWRVNFSRIILYCINPPVDI